METIVKLRGSEITARYKLVELLRELCRNDPLSAHCYTVYDIMYEPDRTEIVLLFSNNSIKSYALIWYGGRLTIQDLYGIHIWNPTPSVVEEIDVPPKKRADIQLYSSSPSDVEMIVNHFRTLGFKVFRITEFYDMICSYRDFKPSPLEKLAIKLGEEHANLYRELELERGVEISLEEARAILRQYTHYGVVVDNVLASVATRYITLPYIHVIGGVFTRKKYRGRGYAKAVVSVLTREALVSRATPGLHVEVDNKPAIRVYRELGYKATRTRPWIFAYPSY